MSDEPASYIAIGDIHGCHDSLVALLTQLEAYPNRTLVFLGDYVDRGPDSFAVIETLRHLALSRECVFLRGNHEQMLLDALMDPDPQTWQMWMLNGGGTTLRSYESRGMDIFSTAGHADFFVATEMYHETDQFLFVHGGIDPHKSVADNLATGDSYDFMWERRHLKNEPVWEKTVVFGHTPMKDVLMHPRMVGLDTGCVFSDHGYGRLSALLLPEMRIIDCNCNDTLT